MGYLDEIPQRYSPPGSKKYKPKENFEELQNEGRDIVVEDFSDSPFADENKKHEKI